MIQAACKLPAHIQDTQADMLADNTALADRTGNMALHTVLQAAAHMGRMAVAHRSHNPLAEHKDS